MTTSKRLSVAAALFLLPAAAFAQSATFDVSRISETGVGEKIGTITAVETKQGMSFQVEIRGLPAGEHGFHVHERGDCGPGMKDGKMSAGEAAGPHYDPEGKKSHRGPSGDGHKGDLPMLSLDDKGTAKTVNVENLKMSDISGKAIVIHAGGDNYTDQPENGGGGARIACGVVPRP